MRENDDGEHYHRHHNHGPSGFRLFWPLLIGAILIIVGLSFLLGIDIGRYFWAILAILIGLLIIIRAILGRSSRY